MNHPKLPGVCTCLVSFAQFLPQLFHPESTVWAGCSRAARPHQNCPWRIANPRLVRHAPCPAASRVPSGLPVRPAVPPRCPCAARPACDQSHRPSGHSKGSGTLYPRLSARKHTTRPSIAAAAAAAAAAAQTLPPACSGAPADLRRPAPLKLRALDPERRKSFLAPRAEARGFIRSLATLPTPTGLEWAHTARVSARICAAPSFAPPGEIGALHSRPPRPGPRPACPARGRRSGAIPYHGCWTVEVFVCSAARSATHKQATRVRSLCSMAVHWLKSASGLKMAPPHPVAHVIFLRGPV